VKLGDVRTPCKHVRTALMYQGPERLLRQLVAIARAERYRLERLMESYGGICCWTARRAHVAGYQSE